MKISLLIASALLVFGCASQPEVPEEGTEGPGVLLNLDSRPLVLESDAELRAFTQEFSLFVEDADAVLRSVAASSVEEEIARIEILRGNLERWRAISENTVLDPETSEISPEGYERFMADLAVLRSRLWDIVREINREIAEASGIDPVDSVPEA
jgi:hypothetical protein